MVPTTEESMILIDPRAGSGKADRGGDLLPYIQHLKVKAQKETLPYGDAAFEGNGPRGKIAIGIERKQLSDVLNCVDDARFAGHQKIGLKQIYQFNILIVEGIWKPDNATGYLMECISTLTWRPYRYRSQMVRYSKLFRYLLSVQLSSTPVIITRDIEHTAFNIVEVYHYFQKKWDEHTSMLEVQRISIPDMNSKPTLTRRWATDLEGIGVKLSQDAERVFKRPIDLAQGDESDWLRIPGIGVAKAQAIVREIRGWVR